MLRILPIFLILLFPAAASAAPADVDRGYGTFGRALADSGGEDNPSAMAVQPDGKTVVVGSTPVNSDGVVMRFTVDGAPDPTFGGGDGVAIVESAGTEWLEAIAVQPDGKLVVAGGTNTGENGIVRRLNADGSPDRQFGTEGLAVLDSAGTEIARGVAVQPDGKIVVAGDTSVDTALAAYRLTAQGKPDNSFDDDGARGISAGGHERGYAVALQADGKIVVAGMTDQGPEYPLLARFDANGKPDETFGPGGWRRAADEGWLYAVAVQRDGTIVAAGTTDDYDGVVYRLSPVEPDMMLAAQGRTLLDLGGEEEAYTLALQADDKIVVGGWTAIGDDPVVWRLLRDGSPDPAFGDRGAAVPGGLGIEWVEGVGVQPDGKIVLATEHNTTNRNVLVARLLGDFQPPAQPQPQPGGQQPPAKAVRCGGLTATIVGTPRRDVIRGTRGRDVIAALGGDDVVPGSSRYTAFNIHLDIDYV
jgi:uncharacterized delta-60 repeat protein